MKKFNILFIFLVMFFSLGAVYADGNFTDLQREINNAESSIEITQNYIYENSSDYGLHEGIIVNKSNFTINGNGHTIDGAGESRIFNIKVYNVTLLNLNIVNGFSETDAGAILGRNITCENITFINNSAINQGGCIQTIYVNMKNCEFINNSAKHGAGIFVFGDSKIEDTIFKDSHNYTSGYVFGQGDSKLIVNNCSFLNLTSNYAPAIFCDKQLNLKNSIFKDLHAYLTAGAIGIKISKRVEIENCIFLNTSSVNNGGALYIDIDTSYDMFNATVLIKNTTFTNSLANFGGALVQLGGNLKIIDSTFSNNLATNDGAAIYVSHTNSSLSNSTVTSNKLLDDEFFDGGGIYCDKSNLHIINSSFENNSKNAVYSYDSSLIVENSSFNNNSQAIYGVFTDCELKNNKFGNDTLSLNNTDYPTVVKENCIKFDLINNTIDVVSLPTRFDSREWGWISSVKDQGEMGACWTFGNCGALESALLKTTGIEFDLSENNMQNSMLKYSKYGSANAKEGGTYAQGLQYLISWFGIFPSKYDVYDELGKLSPLISTDENIHVYDVLFIEPRVNSLDNKALKRAIMECGSSTLSFFATLQEGFYNEKTYAYYQNIYSMTTHEVSVVGWDDNFSARNFLITPPGDGAWIVKNSFGDNFGDKGYFYISYYDPSVLNQTITFPYHESVSCAYLIENQENYTKLYQRDIVGDLDRHSNFTSAKIKYQSVGNDLISAVGSYFKENENYSIEIYVNDKLRHIQNGIAPFTGYHTVRLTKEIPIKENVNFTVLMKKLNVPLVLNSRLHFERNTTFVEINGEWVDIALENKTATLKVYTKDLAIYTEDLVKIYKNDSNFEANIGEVNGTVTFEINGVNYTRISDENGTVNLAINLNPGNYTIKTTFNGISVENNIEVLPTLIAENLVKYFRNESQFHISLIDNRGNMVENANIEMNINGVFYTRPTNENGTAMLNINLEPGEYILTATDPLTGLMMSYNITVLPILTATDIKMTYKDGTQFKAKLVDGQGNPKVDVGITFNVNGVFYTRITNSSGIACLNINLMPGEYIITSLYENAWISNKITIVAKDD